MEKEQRTIMFTRKSANLAQLQEGIWSEGIPARLVAERVVELPPESYARFAGNLLAAYSFLREHQDRMYVDTQGVWHCLLVKAKGARDGILVNAEGSTFARYSAYCPDCRPFLPKQQESERRREQPPMLTDVTHPRRVARHRRLFLVTYDYVESGKVQRCGFLCEATSIRAAAEAFWNQHPGNCFSLQRVTDGRLEAYWVKETGQFVTIPGREEEEVEPSSRFEAMLRSLQGERQPGHQRDPRSEQMRRGRRARLARLEAREPRTK